VDDVDLAPDGEWPPLPRSLSTANRDWLGEVGLQQLLLGCSIVVVPSPDPLGQSRHLMDILPEV
jgi:hypothetical protein